MNSPRSSDKMSLNNNHLQKVANDSYNRLPKITSTPLPSFNARGASSLSTATKLRLLGPRRYSLSDVSSPINGTPHARHDLSDLGVGPLLTSMNYKDNISIYEETKSTGLAGRIVRYNEEAEQKKPMVQEKYNGAGLFPIVHLFKNRSNSEETPKRTFIKIGTPDRIKCLPPPSREISNKILEEIAKPSPVKLKNQLRQLDHRTENVLDALKEISRKRILAHEDYEHHQEQSKKIKTDELQRIRTSKRTQDNDELNQSLNTSMTQSSKKICVYDEYAASRSSSDMSFKVNNFHNLQNNDRVKITAKRKTTSTTTEDTDRSKQVKLVTTETQTEPAITKDQPDNLEKQAKPPKKVSPLKVFDAHPLENLRKNRLAALMGTLVGKEVVFQSQARESATDKEPKSILSTNRRNLESLTEKHVHFDVPDTPRISTSTEIQSKPPETTALHTSVAFSTNISTALGNPTEISTATITTASIAAPKFSFGSPKAISSVAPTICSTQSTTLPIQTPASTSESVPKMGGFKFNLDPTTSSSAQLNLESKPDSKTAMPNLGLPSSPAATKLQFGLNLPSSSSTSTPTFSLNMSSVTSSTPSGLNFKGSLPSSNVAPSASTFSFGSTVTSQTSTTSAAISTSSAALTTCFSTQNSTVGATPSFSFGKVIPATSASLLGNTAVSNSNSGFGGLPVTTAASSGFGLVSTPSSIAKPVTTASSFGFGSQLSTTTISATPSFGFGSSVTSAPSTTTSTFSFGPKPTTSQSTFAFGAPATTTSSNAFGTPSTSSIASTTFNFSSKPSSTPTFGGGGSTPAFGGSTSAPTFGITTSNNTNSSFGNPTTTATFGSSTAVVPTFGSGTSVPTFGSSNTNAPAFPSNTATPSFGGATTTQSTFASPSNIFGAKTTSSSTFGTPTTSTTSLFGSSVAPTPTFGNGPTASSTQPLFGSSNALGSSTFGTKPESTTKVASSSLFGGNKDAPFAFGANKSSGISSIGSTAPTSSFGSSSTPAFGQTNQTGSMTNAFGSAGGNQTFSNNNGGSAFGANSSGFGSASVTPAAESAFGSGSNVASTFGSSTNTAFGNQTGSQNKAFSFGASSTGNQNTTPFAFGGANNSATETPKPSFNFTGGPSTTPMFGAAGGTSNPPSFGSANNSNAPTFGAGAGSVPSFGTSFGGAAPAAAPGPGGVGMFNIGAGASTGRSRPVAKAVRRRT